MVMVSPLFARLWYQDAPLLSKYEHPYKNKLKKHPKVAVGINLALWVLSLQICISFFCNLLIESEVQTKLNIMSKVIERVKSGQPDGTKLPSRNG